MIELFVTKSVCIALSVAMLVTAYVASRMARSWLAPACIYSVAWFLFTFIPLISLTTVPANPLAVGYILLTCVAFSIPTLVSAAPERGPATDWSDDFDTPMLRRSFYVFAAMTVAATIFNAAAQGLSINALASDFYATSNSLIADRYNDNTVRSIFGQIANVGGYVAAGLGGLVFPGYRSRTGRIAVLVAAMLPPLFVMVVFGVKGTIFLCIALFFAGTLVRRLRRGDHRLVDYTTLARSVIGVLVLVPFITVSFVARGLYEADDPTVFLDGLIRYYASYTSAHLYAFSDWFSSYIGQQASQTYAKEEVSGGFYTFMSLFFALGFKRFVPPGVFVEYYQYGWYVQTNVYTMFRGLIIDFNIIGSLIAMFVMGALSQSMFDLMRNNRRATWSVAFYILMIGYVYTSFIISLLIWNSTYPVFVILAIVLMVNGAQRRPAVGVRTVSSVLERDRV